MAGIQMSGLASGLDTASLIAQLMSVERIPRQRIERNQAAVQQRQDHLRDIQTKLKTLRNAAADLQSGALWNPVKVATSDDITRVGARVIGSGATVGSYDIEVTQLATRETQKWAITPQGSSTNLRLRDDATNTLYTYNIAANATVDQIVSTINANPNSFVVASKDATDGKLVLTSKTWGAGGGFTVTDAPNDVLVSQDYNADGVNAIYSINGAAKTSTTNVDSASIAGVEITLQGATTPGTPTKVTITEQATDKATVAAKFKAFVEAYNAVVDFTRAKITEKSDPKAATVTDAKKGVLYGDAGLTTVLSNLRNSLMNPLTLAGNQASMDEMHEIGLSTGSAVSTIDQSKVQGKLTFDEAKFNRAWDADRASVERLIRGDGSVTGNGFSQRMEALLKPMTEVSGLLDSRIQGAGNELKTIASRLTQMDRRLEKKEEFYRKQFTALETALGRAQSIQQQMAGQLAGLPQFGGSDK